MRLVIAVGGNALLRRGQIESAANQMENIRRAAGQIAQIADTHDIVLTHGNGPQVGLLALQSAAYAAINPAVQAYPFDVLVSETEGMIGYLFEQELTNLLPASRTVVSLLTRVEVDARDPAFAHPLKPIGPMYTPDEAQRIASARHWSMAGMVLDCDASWPRQCPCAFLGLTRFAGCSSVVHLSSLRAVAVFQSRA